MLNRQSLILTVALCVASSPAFGWERRPAKTKSPQQVAINKGLAYLATQQQKSGAWQLKSRGESTAITSLAVLAFLANGHEPGNGDYGKRIQHGIDWVISQQQKGKGDRKGAPGYLVVPKQTFGPMYSHAISTIMLAEALKKVDAKQAARIRIALAKAVGLIVAAQKVKKDARHTGGWRYQPDAQDSDLSVSSWQIKALYAAKSAGIKVPESAIRSGLEYLNRCQKRTGGGFGYQPDSRSQASATRTGVAVSSLALCGQQKSKTATNGAEFLLRQLPRVGGQYLFYGTYGCSITAFQMGGKYQQTLWPRIRATLLDLQSRDGSWGRGSRERVHGHAYTTALAVLALSVESKNLLIHK